MTNAQNKGIASGRGLLTTLLCGAAIAALGSGTVVRAQDTSTPVDVSEADAADGDVIVVTGIRTSLATALAEERAANNIIEVIQAEDIGKLPDQNLAEVLENVTGVQITRTAGVGTAVQIRGTNANRTEINGVSTVSSGAGRSGISFEDLPAALISSVEVTKVPTARTIEGSVGGTINLRTIRPLSLNEPLFAARAQAEYSDLAQSTLPRLSATVGKVWDVGGGEVGVVVSGSYARQDVAAFRPRVDRDGVVLPGSSPSAEAFPFLRIQFLNQETDNFEYETYNITTAVEIKPIDNLRFYGDITYNDQTRAQESNRVQFSGVSAGDVVANTSNTSFETVDFGSGEGPNGPIELGSVQATTSGILGVGAFDTNLRTSSDTGARVTQSGVYDLGMEWDVTDRLKLGVEGSISTSKSQNPNFSTTLDFINPNSAQPMLGRSLDNAIPVIFDLRGGILQFDVAPGLATSPTSEQLLDPANYQLRQIQQSFDTRDNRESAIRVDLSYDMSDMVPFISSVDAGYRQSRTRAINNDSTENTNFTNSTSAFNRPNGNLFSDILIAAPDNFGDADGRELFVRDFLIVDGALSFDDPEAVLSALNAAITASNAAATQGPPAEQIGVPSDDLGAFFSIREKTDAVYGQVNFDGEDLGIPVRGSAGVRYVKTNLTSVGNNVDAGAVIGQVVTQSSYDFFLPRVSMVVDVSDDILLRGGISRDIRRPNFNDLSTSVTFGTSANAPVPTGNPDLIPEVVWSYDAAVDYYFAPASLISVGFFHKSRTNLFADTLEFPANNLVGNQLNIDITPPCEDGGIFNPIADRNINNPIQGQGICVPLQSTFNVDGTTTQTGVEVAFQYDLSQFEDTLGFASGFGFIGNFTYQKTGGSAADFRAVGGPRNIFDALGVTAPTQRIGLLDLSKYAYNATLFYDMFGLNARVRYTWRSSFESGDDAFQFGVPLVNASRGQLNASLNYDITDNINVGVEGINLLREDANQYCVNNKALLCFNGLTDRRITGGLSVTF